jgi:MFS family permease
VLVPVVLEEPGMSAIRAGLVLTFLRAAFAFTATIAGALLPVGWTNRARCLAGGIVTSGAMAAGLSVSPSPPALAAILAVVGLGLGIFTSANNAQVMGVISAASSASGGGMVNMARGLGTSLGIAIVTLCLEVAPSGPDRARWAFASLLVGAVATVLTAALSATTASGDKDDVGMSESVGTG